jgi:hypothetical protein
MEMQTRKGRLIAPMALMAVVTIFFGFLVSIMGYLTLRQWSSIGAGFSACGVLWALAGPIMFVTGWWVLLSLGRRSTPLWLAGAASIAAGGALVVGVLTHVVPCSGPS